MDAQWYKDAVFYEVYVRGFFDTTRDGNGDLRGLTEKLDYLTDLGVDCLWLMPIYPSPRHDDGYDIADFYSIDPSIGTVADFRELTEAAHSRGIRIIADLVINHTSSAHPWFQEARRDPSSKYRDYYVWSDSDQKYQGVRVIFRDTHQLNWTWDPVARQYYWHRFYSHQPDLNFDNPAVRQEMLDIMAHWLDLGIRRLLAEANQWPEDLVPYFGSGAGDEFHMAFNFPLMPRMFMALRREDRTPIVDIMEHMPAIPEACQWALFLRNHDELTLEMVTDEDRDYMYGEYAKDPRMRLNLGIRRRLAPLVDNSQNQIELLYGLLLSLPGTPVLYYGDELAMGDNVHLGDRNGVRTPMQWSGDRNAGFSRADPSSLYLPVITDPVYHYQAVNVEAQQRSPFSLLNWVKRLIRVRKQNPLFARGTLEFVDAGNPHIVAYLRRHDGRTALCVNNLSRFSQPAEIDLRRFAGHAPVEMLGGQKFRPIGDDSYPLTLGPHSFFWLSLERLPAETPAHAVVEAAAIS